MPEIEPMPDLPLFGEDAVFDHVGLAVRGIERCTGGRARIIADPIQKVNVSFVKIGDLRVELIEPAGEDSPVTASLRSNRPLLHICYRVRDLERALAIAKQNGFALVRSPQPAPAFANRRIAFVYSRSYGVFELVEGA